MRKFAAILGTVVLMIFAGTALGEVVLKQAPLEWQDVANLEGEALFNKLCSVCHGTSGKGDGPAVGALQKGVPDLTVLAVNNGGVYADKNIENAIFGSFRVATHGTIDMPAWGEQFMYARPGWSTFPRTAYARERVQSLVAHIESLQVNFLAENR
jgi:mono/diheme cytochrome c family protein